MTPSACSWLAIVGNRCHDPHVPTMLPPTPSQCLHSVAVELAPGRRHRSPEGTHNRIIQPRQHRLSPLQRPQQLQPHRNRCPLPRSSSSAPAPKTTGAHPVTESSSRSTQLRPSPQVHPPLILLPNPQSDPWRKELQVLTSPYVRDGIPVNQEQMDYVAATLNAAGRPSQHSTRNYAKVNSEHHYSKITPHWFMLTIPYLGATVRLKEPTKTRPMLLWTHASSVGGARGILRSRQIHPSIQHSSECPAFYAQGWKITGHADYDAEEIARTMSQNWSMSFNMAQLLLFGRAVGTCQPIRAGGEQACIEALDSSERPDVIHWQVLDGDSRSKPDRWTRMAYRRETTHRCPPLVNMHQELLHLMTINAVSLQMPHWPTIFCDKKVHARAL